MAAAKNKSVAEEEEVKTEPVVENQDKVEQEIKEEKEKIEQAVAVVEEESEDVLDFDLDELGELSGLDGLRAGDYRVPYAKLYQKKKKIDGVNVDMGDLRLPNGNICLLYTSPSPRD